jgi:ornithine decarboxylase
MKPKFIISKSKIIQQYGSVKDHCDLVSYSSKTNPKATSILEKDTDSLFSVHLINELANIKDCSRVIFLAQGWDSAVIDELLLKGIKWFVADNEEDLDEFLAVMEKKETNQKINQKINLLLRMKLKENTIRTEKYFVFGMDSEIINIRIKELAEKNYIGLLGIHFHRKSQNLSEWNYQYELRESLDKETLNLVKVVNIGGGLPAEYANTNVEVVKGIFGRIDEMRKWLNSLGIKLMIEPGRFIAAPAVKLITEIKAVYENNIIVNASVYNSDLDALIVPVKLLVEGEVSKEEAMSRNLKGEKYQMYVIKGITPCSMDLFRYRVYLPVKKKGDLIVFLNAGAYNFSSDFCDLEKIETEMVE